MQQYKQIYATITHRTSTSLGFADVIFEGDNLADPRGMPRKPFNTLNILKMSKVENW